MQTVANALEVLRAWAQKLGPYVLLEVLLPGGTLFALLLFVYRRSRLPCALLPRAQSPAHAHAESLQGLERA